MPRDSDDESGNETPKVAEVVNLATVQGRRRAREEGGEAPPRARPSTKLQRAIASVAGRFPNLRYDEFSRRNVGGSEFIRTEAMLSIEMDCGYTPSTTIADTAIEQVAQRRRFDSLRDFMHALPPWDRTERLSAWLQTYLGATDDPKYLEMTGRYFLIGAIARALRPGCKFDNTLLLEGRQGNEKSTAVEVLGGEFFGRPSSSEFASRDHKNEIQGHWFLEFPDLGNLSNANKRKLKAFFSETEDEFTKKYAREPIRVPRRCCFVITDNPDPDGFSWLEDPTGARRIWAVSTKKIDIEGLRRDRLQLFAEALGAFRAGERWWPSHEEQKTLFNPRQEDFLGVNELHEPVAVALEEAVAHSGYGKGSEEFYTTTEQILGIINREARTITARTKLNIMKVGECLRRLGLETRGSARPRRYYFKRS